MVPSLSPVTRTLRRREECPRKLRNASSREQGKVVVLVRSSLAGKGIRKWAVKVDCRQLAKVVKKLPARRALRLMKPSTRPSRSFRMLRKENMGMTEYSVGSLHDVGAGKHTLVLVIDDLKNILLRCGLLRSRGPRIHVKFRGSSILNLGPFSHILWAFSTSHSRLSFVPLVMSGSCLGGTSFAETVVTSS